MDKIQKFTTKFFNNKYVVFGLCAASAYYSAKYIYQHGKLDGQLDIYNTVYNTKLTINDVIDKQFENK